MDASCRDLATFRLIVPLILNIDVFEWLRNRTIFDIPSIDLI